jgi:hypothetical protein
MHKMDRLCNKLVCLSEPVKVADNSKDTWFPCNMSISHTLQICNARSLDTIFNNLVCLSKPVKVTDNSKLACYVIYPFSLHYESVMFYSTGSWCRIHNTSFSSLLTNEPNKLECLFLASLYSLV